MIELPAPLPLQRILRCFVMIEIVLMVVYWETSEMGDRMLPEVLRQYKEADISAGFGVLDKVWLVLAVPGVVICVLAWIGLWRGWRLGRRLYTIGWVVFTPLIAFDGPTVNAGPVALIDTMASIVGGVILGLLYFSDLRHVYARKVQGS